MNIITDFLHNFGPEILKRTHEHVYMSLLALAIAIAVAVPLGILLSRVRSPYLTAPVMGIVSIIQTIPSLALVALVAVFFILLGLRTVGMTPALMTLFLYALLPILRNTYTGLRQVDSTVIEVARGMGMTRTQILVRVELPLALPVIMAGIRIATVWTIGVAALCALIGAGGLGILIMQGLRQANAGTPALVAGIVPACALALLLDFLLATAERWLTPEGIQSEEKAA